MNDIDTIFEPEIWTKRRHPPLARDTEYKTNYQPGQEEMMSQGDNYQRRMGTRREVTEEEARELFRHLPHDVLLPSDPIRLSREQEMTACKLACMEMENAEPGVLRDVYLECSKHDKHLEGYCNMDNLDHSLKKQKVHR